MTLFDKIVLAFGAIEVALGIFGYWRHRSTAKPKATRGRGPSVLHLEPHTIAR